MSATGEDGAGGSESADARRNVVLVTIDSLRADHCSYWGYDRETTPTLDVMAEEGFVFEQAIAPGPSTYESMPAVFTGRHMTSFRSSDGDEDALDARTRNVRMNMTARTIAEWFDERGYATGAFTTNPYTGAHTDFARGFDAFEDFMGDGEGPFMRRAAHLPVLGELKHLVTLLRGDRAAKGWTEYYDEVVRWVDEVEEPFFLWLFLLDAHTPYLVDERYLAAYDRGRPSMYYHNWRLWMAKKWGASRRPSALNREALVDLYDAAVRSVDDCLARLRADLSDTDPAFVIHADHGEAFGEHGSFGHDAALFEENLRVPLVVHGGGFEGRERAPVSLVDLAAVLRAAAVEHEAPDVSRGPVLAKTFDARQFALRGPDWKYVCRAEPSEGRIAGERLYHLTDDPGERRPAGGDERLESTCRRTIAHRLGHERELNAVVDGAAGFVEGANR